MDALTAIEKPKGGDDEAELEAELREKVPLAYQKACRIAGLMGALDIALDEADIVTALAGKADKATGALIHLVDVLREEADALADLLDRASILVGQEAA
jgi:hypothetical protein